MRIGVIGAGNVGGALGTGWARAGHEVRYGVRDAGDPAGDPKLAKLVAESGGRAAAASVAEAAAWGEAVALTVPWGAAKDAIASAGDLAGKVLLDCTNPLTKDLSGLAVGPDTSAGEQVAGWAQGAKVVKIFNTTGANNMADPRYGGEAATMLYCGDDAGAKETAARLAADLGFEPIDLGPLTRARLLEPFALLWITLAYPQGHGRNIAWKLLKR
jgi:8-hydroxy-5-deazaflavin:NADPH oxidoreductase